ncbi:hypothetical protein DYB28_004636 [Aphanomyces astaci]|uniref:Chromo domain-containing protein n=1 Tax=Aphanomyces astaci TaxID=112090 RepID=A0A9X8EAC3_APHAT|nr:hypothetical protein DYB28_004636 [Aphanomyces astaci]
MRLKNSVLSLPSFCSAMQNKGHADGWVSAQSKPEHDAWAYLLGKLWTNCCGPAVVTEVDRNWVYDVENLLTHDVRPIYASCLKFYADCDLDVIFELLDQVTHNSEEFEIKAMVDARYIPTTRVCELLIKWRGLQDEGNLWEPPTTSSPMYP